MSKKSIVTYEFDPDNPKPLTAAQRAELKALAALPDDEIDTSDIPPATVCLMLAGMKVIAVPGQAV